VTAAAVLDLSVDPQQLSAGFHMVKIFGIHIDEFGLCPFVFGMAGS